MKTTCRSIGLAVFMGVAIWESAVLPGSAGPIVPLVAPNSIADPVQEAETAIKNRNYDNAEAIWRKVIKREPRNAKAYLELGKVLNIGRSVANPDRSKEVISAYNKAIELDPSQPNGYLTLADFLRFSQEDTAIAIYRKAIAVATPSAEVYYMLGITLTADPDNNRVISADRRNEAIACYRKAIEIAPQDGKSYIALGNELEMQGKLDGAIAAYQAAMKLNYYGAYVAYSNLLERQNRLEEMVPIYEQAIQQHPKDGPYRLLAITLDRLNRFDEAIVAYQKVIELYPDSLYTYFSLGDLWIRQGKSGEALRIYTKAAAVVRPDSLVSPGDAFSYIQVAESLRDRGLFDLAIATYQKVFTLNTKGNRPDVWIGKTLRMQGKLDESAAELRRLIAIDPSFIEAYSELMTTLQQQGKTKEAGVILRKIFEIDANNVRNRK